MALSGVLRLRSKGALMADPLLFGRQWTQRELREHVSDMSQVRLSSAISIHRAARLAGLQAALTLAGAARSSRASSARPSPRARRAARSECSCGSRTGSLCRWRLVAASTSVPPAGAACPSRALHHRAQ